MMKKPGAFLGVLVLSLAACSKKPDLLSGSGALKLKGPVWATYAWSHRRIACIIYFVTPSGMAVNPEGFAPTVKTQDNVDTIDGALDGFSENSKAAFRCEPKKGELLFDKRTYRLMNGSIFLIHVGSPSKVVQIQVPTRPFPKDPEEIASFMESEVHRIAKEYPRVGEFPKEPTPAEKNKKK